jgi:hypothetical protein
VLTHPAEAEYAVFSAQKLSQATEATLRPVGIPQSADWVKSESPPTYCRRVHLGERGRLLTECEGEQSADDRAANPRVSRASEAPVYSEVGKANYRGIGARESTFKEALSPGKDPGEVQRRTEPLFDNT